MGQLKAKKNPLYGPLKGLWLEWSFPIATGAESSWVSGTRRYRSWQKTLHLLMAKMNERERWWQPCPDGRKQDPQNSVQNCGHCQLHMHRVQSVRNDSGLRVDCRSDNWLMTECVTQGVEHRQNWMCDLGWLLLMHLCPLLFVRWIKNLKLKLWIWSSYITPLMNCLPDKGASF